MDIKAITELVKTEYVFGVLFIMGLFYIAKIVRETLSTQAQDNKNFEAKVVEIYEAQIEKAHDREDKLMCHQKEMTTQLEGISASHARFASSLDKLERKTDEIAKQIWKNK